MTNSLLLKMAIEIVDLPIEHGDFPVRYVNELTRGYLLRLWCNVPVVRYKSDHLMRILQWRYRGDVIGIQWGCNVHGDTIGIW